ncbi:MAG TPA: glycosyltransferase [Bryobacteraceae bacterium]|nr:glycosyltransferase [Bryobacteraceae bacterium]
MKKDKLNIVVLGLSLSSSWGNGHATTYRALLREMAALGHKITFLERDAPWYRDNRDLAQATFCDLKFYASIEELRERYTDRVRRADVVVVGSYVPAGTEVGQWVTRIAGGITAFYDIDTPVTLAKLRDRDYEYISNALAARYHLYLSFTGGSTLRYIETVLGSRCARALYCSVDPELHYKERAVAEQWQLGYLGTYSSDRQPALESLLISPAQKWPEGRFAVAGPLYPPEISWPENVMRVDHLPPSRHRRFYNAQRFTLNITRREMIGAGYSPSVRLFEAAACGTPIITDPWEGLGRFFEVGKEILVARSTEQCLKLIRDLPADTRLAVAERARRRVLAEHTASQRAQQLEEYLFCAIEEKAAARRRVPTPCATAVVS